MSFLNPTDATEVLYGASGDVRNEINAHLPANTAGHYADEQEVPGSLIVGSLRRATRLINTYLKPVYADEIPFTAVADVPKFLEEAADDIATYYVWRSATVLLGQMSEERKKNYFDQYVDPKSGFLTLISQGKMTLAELASTNEGEASEARAEGRTPIFDLDDPKQQEVDPDLLRDIAEERDK